jgi:hypothetical protein
VAKFTKDGDWVALLGEPGGEAREPEYAAQYRQRREGNIYVADRGNRRIR